MDRKVSSIHHFSYSGPYIKNKIQQRWAAKVRGMEPAVLKAVPLPH